MKNLTALAQSLVRRQKGTRLQSKSIARIKKAAEASPERAEKKPHVANATGAVRWLNSQSLQQKKRVNY